MLRRVSTKSLSEIVSEWDALASVRFRQISTGRDLSYNRVITPALLQLITPLSPSSILDVGCGTGIFTSRLSEFAPHIVGVDPSGASIKIARTLNDSRASFVQETIEDFSKNSEDRFDVVVANMVLMNTLSLSEFLKSCRRVLNPNGAFAFSITHPCFWPNHYGYGQEDWFHYEDELVVEAPFRITTDQDSGLMSTHVHRPVSSYFNAFVANGLTIQTLREPIPPKDVDPAYRAQWKYPRYLVGICIAASQRPNLQALS